jgi:hypothetical protein
MIVLTFESLVARAICPCENPVGSDPPPGFLSAPDGAGISRQGAEGVTEEACPKFRKVAR